RLSSSSVPTGSAPGRVDSPPTSMSAAPCCARRSPCSTAAPTEKNRPPSEKESGVTFTTPMTTGWLRSSVLSAQRSTSGGGGGGVVSGSQCCPAGIGPPAAGPSAGACGGLLDSDSSQPSGGVG